jgi:putative DNA primase/helicase
MKLVADSDGPKPGDLDDWGNPILPPTRDTETREDDEVLPAEARVLEFRRKLDEPEDLEISEDAIALAFTKRHRNDMRYCKQHGAWYEWDGSRWQRDHIDRAFHFAREIARSMGDSKGRICKASVASGVERFARADPAHAITADTWDGDPLRLGTPGGIIDLQTGSLLRPDPSAYITRLTGCTPDARKPKRWLEFLNDATRGDATLIAYLQRMCGYLLTGLTVEHALFFIHGPGGNGKSVFVNILTHILKDYHTTAPIDAFTAGLGNRHPTELAMLQGARGVFANETEAGSQWAEARIKAMTGGDPISARFMRQDFFTFQPQFKLLIVGNHAPAIKNVDEALRRRFNIIPFLHKPTRPDHLLEERMKEEAGAIFGWMIDGCMDWQENGLGRPKAIVEATDDYFAGQDVFGQWLEDACDLGREFSDTPTALFDAWARYSKANGETSGSLKSFSSELANRGFKKGRTMSARLFFGLRVRPISHSDNWHGD